MNEQFATYMHTLVRGAAAAESRLTLRIVREDVPGRGLCLYAVPALPSEAGRVLRRELEAIGWVVTGVA